MIILPIIKFNTNYYSLLDDAFYELFKLINKTFNNNTLLNIWLGLVRLTFTIVMRLPDCHIDIALVRGIPHCQN